MTNAAAKPSRFQGLRRLLEHVYLARTEIAGFALLWPLAGKGLQTPLLRGLADIDPSQAFMVGLLATAIALFLVLTTILTLLWGPIRLASDDIHPTPRMTPPAWPRAVVASVGLLCLLGFFHDVNGRSDHGGLMPALTFGAVVAVFIYLTYAWFVDPQWVGIVFARRPKEVTRQDLSASEWLPVVGAIVSVRRRARKLLNRRAATDDVRLDQAATAIARFSTV